MPDLALATRLHLPLHMASYDEKIDPVPTSRPAN